MKSFGERLREYRTQRGLNQMQMAYAIGITVQAYSQIENGLSGKAYEKLPILAKILGCRIDDLFPEMDEDAKDEDEIPF